MHGSQSIEKKVALWNNIVALWNNIIAGQQFKMLLVSISVGVFAGLFIAMVRLNLGMPGHKAFLWMTPVLIARLRGGCKIGTTAGGLFAALTTYSLGANLAGGALGMPIIVLAGIILDWTVNFLEDKKISGVAMVLVLGLAGIVANILCLAKRMILPIGLSPHFIFGLSGFWFKLFSYAFFGFASGTIAAITEKLIKRKQQGTKK